MDDNGSLPSSRDRMRQEPSVGTGCRFHDSLQDTPHPLQAELQISLCFITRTLTLVHSFLSGTILPKQFKTAVITLENCLSSSTLEQKRKKNGRFFLPDMRKLLNPI